MFNLFVREVDEQPPEPPEQLARIDRRLEDLQVPEHVDPPVEKLFSLLNNNQGPQATQS